MRRETNGWETRSLGLLTSLIKDGSHGTHEDVADGVPLLSAKDVRNGTLDIPDNCRRISLKDFRTIHRNYSFQADDILITLVGSIGRCCILSGKEPAFTIQRSVGVIRADGVSPKYLFHFLRSQSFQKVLHELTNASAQGGVYLGSLGTIEIDFPHLADEQVKIAEILSTIDQAIEQTEALIAKQERIKTGLMQELLTRGIDERGNLRSESTHQFKDSPLGRIPVEWEPTSIDSLTKFVTSGSRGWAKHYTVEGDRFLRIGDLTRDHINLRSDDVAFVTPPANSEGKRTAVEAGDVLVSITADLGIIGVIPEDFSTAYVNQHIALARIERDAANPRYVGWYLSSWGGQRQFEALNESGAKAGLNLPTIRNLQVPIPSDPIYGREEQNRIAAILDRAAKSVEDAMTKKDKLVRLKTGVMQDLLTGKKRVTPLLEMVETQ